MKLSDKKRLNILDAAEQLFFECGVEHATMDQIAKAAQASKRTVYNHFSTKEELFQAILTRMFAQLDDAQELQFNNNQPIKSQLREIAQQEVELLTSERFLRIAKITFMQMLQQPSLAKSIANNEFGCMRYLGTFLQQANAAQRLQIEDIDFAAKQFVYALKGFIFYPILYGFETHSSLNITDIIERNIATFLAQYQPN
jgi:TetR/AcrR family transcriptional regulator of autoinduction and epiphytic fitness